MNFINFGSFFEIITQIICQNIWITASSTLTVVLFVFGYKITNIIKMYNFTTEFSGGIINKVDKMRQELLERGVKDTDIVYTIRNGGRDIISASAGVWEYEYKKILPILEGREDFEVRLFDITKELDEFVIHMVSGVKDVLIAHACTELKYPDEVSDNRGNIKKRTVGKKEKTAMETLAEKSLGTKLATRGKTKEVIDYIKNTVNSIIEAENIKGANWGKSFVQASVPCDGILQFHLDETSPIRTIDILSNIQVEVTSYTCRNCTGYLFYDDYLLECDKCGRPCCMGFSPAILGCASSISIFNDHVVICQRCYSDSDY